MYNSIIKIRHLQLKKHIEINSIEKIGTKGRENNLHVGLLVRIIKHSKYDHTKGKQRKRL